MSAATTRVVWRLAALAFSLSFSRPALINRRLLRPRAAFYHNNEFGCLVKNIDASPDPLAESSVEFEFYREVTTRSPFGG